MLIAHGNYIKVLDPRLRGDDAKASVHKVIKMLIAHGNYIKVLDPRLRGDDAKASVHKVSAKGEISPKGRT